MNEQMIADITRFVFVSDPPRSADILFLPGDSNPEPAEQAAALYRAGYAPLLMPSGKYSPKFGAFSGVKTKADIYRGPYITECDFLCDVLCRGGVPREAILCERQAEHTKANAFFSRALADAHGITVRRAIVVCKSFHARRCQMLYQLAFPETEILISSVDCYGISAQSWHTTAYGIERVLGEVARCGNQFVDEVKDYLLHEGAAQTAKEDSVCI